MSKIFGQLKVNDEVYFIKGNSVEIVKVQKIEEIRAQSGEPAPRLPLVFATIGNKDFVLRADLSSFYDVYDDDTGDIYSDIDEAMRRMQDICAEALHDYREASGALNLLETKKNGGKE